MATSPANNQKISLHYAISNQQEGLFPVKGQGTVSVSPEYIDNALRIVLSAAGGSCVGLTISSEYLELWIKTAGDTSTLARSADSALLLDKAIADLPYWMSLDTNNKRIRYGKGEMLHELMLFEYCWADNDSCPLNTFSKEVQNITSKGRKSTTSKYWKFPSLSIHPRTSSHHRQSQWRLLPAIAPA